ncbi:MAG: bacterial Ig-like domain-containing protein [Treponema sp.]|nr:bacterial Ig-like domain-containing protein [Treponema sp.]
MNAADVSGYNANTPGTQTLTVTIGGKNVQFTVKVQTTGNVAVNLEYPISGIPDNIVLSKTGTLASIALEITGTYTIYAWYLNADETPTSTSDGYTLNAANCRIGTNVLTVEVRVSGDRYYSKKITFTVTK